MNRRQVSHSDARKVFARLPDEPLMSCADEARFRAKIGAFGAKMAAQWPSPPWEGKLAAIGAAILAKMCPEGVPVSPRERIRGSERLRRAAEPANQLAVLQEGLARLDNVARELATARAADTELAPSDVEPPPRLLAIRSLVAAPSAPPCPLVFERAA